jgi:hypothetical protein
MTTPEPTAAESLAEKVARTWYATSPVSAEMWPTFDAAPAIVKDGLLAEARRMLAAIQAAGVAVVELPEVQPREGLINGIGIQIEVLAQDGRGWEVTGCHFPGFEEDHVTIGDLGWRDLDRVERDAGRLLAAVAEIRRMRAEHQGGESR